MYGWNLTAGDESIPESFSSYRVFMKLISEIARERLVYHERIDLVKSKPIFKIHRFSVYKLKIIKRLYSADIGEINFLIQDDRKPAEKCIVYAILWEPNTIHQIKYWRAAVMDQELGWFVMKAFINGYLIEKYNVE